MNSRFFGWDPFREFEDVQHRVSNLLALPRSRSLFETSKPLESSFARPDVESRWNPPVDIEENDKEYVFKIELVDMKREDIQVRIDQGILSISGERKAEHEEADIKKKYHRIERSYGAFQRSFSVPENADIEQVHAEFKNGLLSVRLAKSEKGKPKLIDVKVN